MTALKNITDGQVQLNVDAEDRVSEQYKFIRVPGGDIIDTVRRKNPNIQTHYFIENIRTGSFAQISENYMIQSQAQKGQQAFTTDSFETEMKVLKQSFEQKLKRSITLFQGIYAGMALLFTITLNLSSEISQDLVRVEDQAIRVISLLSCLGAIYSAISAKDQYDYVKIRGTSGQIDQKYKYFLLSIIEMLLYFVSYVLFNVSHMYAVNYNIQKQNYQQLSSLTTAYTAICLIAWIITNANTYQQ